ncbi:MAG: phosphoribosylformylglycinamidine synthase subunit PurQ, partial [Clostridia bacterium]|nr:phosphoribosylformylglycinamidine synthase subunit PurQ [Clostridia bacterium]
PFAALLGAYKAQRALGLASIGGKDSMSGSFEDIHVPPTLISFAVTVEPVKHVASPEFKQAGHRVVLLAPERDEHDLPKGESMKAVFAEVAELLHSGRAVSAWTLGFGGVAEAIMKMGFGNGLGFVFDKGVTLERLFKLEHGAFVVELAEGVVAGTPLGTVLAEPTLLFGDKKVSLDELYKISEDKLSPLFPRRLATPDTSEVPVYAYDKRSTVAPAVTLKKPRFLIPVFPGTNCEYDTAKAVEKAGGEAQIFVIKNLTAAAITESVSAFAEAMSKSQAVIIPGGFSGGDEPDGSGKFNTAFFRNARVKEETAKLLDERMGLMAGICNGFQALIKLGLVPFGRIVDMEEDFPTLTFNTIGRLQSRMVRTRVSSVMSPWMAECELGEVYDTPIAHGEGRFLAPMSVVEDLAKNGQIALQYVDLEGKPTMEMQYNPNGSIHAIECITSPDGRVLGKMAHVERTGEGLYKNIPGNYDMGLFRSAVKYFEGK